MASTQIDGRYRLETRLDGWGVGETFRACDLTGEHPALLVKLLASGTLPSADFTAVAERLGRLRHATVAAVVAHGRHAGRPWLALEAPEGESLQSWIDGLRTHGRRAELTVIAPVFDQVCQAIAAGHRLRAPDTVTHGVLSPASVRFAQRPGAVFDVSVMDFGLGLFVPAGTVTDRSYVLPPERASLHDEATPAADVYALGVLLAAMLGTRPRPGVDLHRALHALGNTEATAQSALGPLRGDVHPSVWQALAVALRRLPEERYRDADRLRDAFRRVVWTPIPETDDPPVRPRTLPREEPRATPAHVVPEALTEHAAAASAARLAGPPLVSADVPPPAEVSPYNPLPLPPEVPRPRELRPTEILPVVGHASPDDVTSLHVPVAADPTTVVYLDDRGMSDNLLGESTSIVPTGRSPRTFTPESDENTTVLSAPTADPDDATSLHVTSPPSQPLGPQPTERSWPPSPTPVHRAPSTAVRPISQRTAPDAEASARTALFVQILAIGMVSVTLLGAAFAIHLHQRHRTEASRERPAVQTLRAPTQPPPVLTPPRAVPSVPHPPAVPVRPPRISAPAPVPAPVVLPTAPPIAQSLAPIAMVSGHGAPHGASSDPAVDAALQRHDWPTARALLTTALSRHPDRPESYARLGDVMLRTGDSAGAVVEYDSAVRLSPRNLTYLHGLARALEARGDRARAIATWQRALAVDNTDAIAHESLSRPGGATAPR